MNFADFAQPHLDRVSRSFSFCIARLEDPLRERVGLSYLLCRLLDTIEDANWESLEDQQRSFLYFHERSQNLTEFNQIQHDKWMSLFPLNLPTGEIELLKVSQTLFEALDSNPLPVKNEIRRTLTNMKNGMSFFMQKKQVHGELRLNNLQEVNQYCFFVAGIVGELLTELLKISTQSEFKFSEISIKAHHFGLFLQKINLLKDQQGDQKEGRFLVPDRQELLISLNQHVVMAFSYLQGIPKSEKGYRLFCAWSLFLGLASLPFIFKSPGSHLLNKIPRFMTQSLLKKVESAIDDSLALEKLFLKYTATLSQIKNDSYQSSKEVSAWFSAAYQGPLKSEDLQLLFV